MADSLFRTAPRRSPVGRPKHLLVACAVAGLAWLLGPAATSAQQPTGQPQLPRATAQGPAATKSAAKPAAKAEATPPDAGGGSKTEAALRSRIEQLEEQLADMQVMVGTLESLARQSGNVPSRPSTGAGSGAGSGGGGDPARVEQLDQQVRQLSSQVEQLAGQVRSLGARPAAGAGIAVVTPAAAPAPGGFGTTIINPDRSGDQIERVLGAPGGAAAGARSQVPAEPLPGAASDGNSKQAYDTAYALLLQQDYAGAEASFEDFLRRYPGDGLAGNAQYWLGESFFVRGNYRSAAGAFLKGYQAYNRSAKAPDSLLKLAMSLDRLGQKDQACASFGELGTKFPQAPANVKTRADTERRRIGCL